MSHDAAKLNLDRRRLLQQAGLLTAGLTVTAFAVERPVDVYADDGPPTAAPAMRHATLPDALDAVAAGATAPALPAAGVIALNRMGFGPRPGDLDAFNQLGADDAARLAAYVEEQLNPAAIDDSACDAIIAGYNFATLDKPLATLWQDHVKAEGISWTERTQPVREVERATLLRAVFSKRQLTEVLADFWHNHFNVYGWDYWSAPVWVHYDRDVIRGNMFGRFYDMLVAVAQSPAMLYYLDNQSNSGGNPNENYARELFELHTLGAENYFGVVPLQIGSDGSFQHPAPKDENGRPLLYVDADVYGATTCFTGWRVDSDTGQFAFDAGAHFPYQKLVLGQAIPDSQGIQDGYDVLRLLANHPGTARHVARKLCRRLISDTPSEAVVQAAADTFLQHKDSPDQLTQVVRTILLSDEFKGTWGEKIKRPFEFCASAMRATATDFTPEDHFFWRYNNIGQPLFQWHPPNGFPDFKEDWSSTMPMLQRWRFINWLLGWKYADSDEYRLRFSHPPAYKTPIDIVDYWSYVLLGRTLPDPERLPIIEFMAYGRSISAELPADQIDERLRYMVGLILVSPSFQWR
ncbi:MAG: DUF1800 domain-containing protein [Caldilineaceae bacterium]